MYSLQWPTTALDEQFASESKDLIFRRILDGLSERLLPGARALLDVGAHTGRFIHLAAQRGLQAEGVELNPLVAAYARRATGLPVHQVNAHDLSAEGRRYDAVTLTDVLEHIPEPASVLRQLRALMSPGAWLSVKVPHGAVQWIKEHVQSVVRPGYRAAIADNLIHVNQFGLRSLRLALEQAGFRDVYIEIGAPEFRPATDGSVLPRIYNVATRCVWRIGNAIPGGTSSPLALHLQAFARSP
jgi:SAM-dependent methyltransferase